MALALWLLIIARPVSGVEWSVCVLGTESLLLIGHAKQEFIIYNTDVLLVYSSC